jgi:hypothetical protein
MTLLLYHYGPQSWSDQYEEERNILLQVLDCPAHSETSKGYPTNHVFKNSYTFTVDLKKYHHQ